MQVWELAERTVSILGKSYDLVVSKEHMDSWGNPPTRVGNVTSLSGVCHWTWIFFRVNNICAIIQYSSRGLNLANA